MIRYFSLLLFPIILLTACESTAPAAAGEETVEDPAETETRVGESIRIEELPEEAPPMFTVGTLTDWPSEVEGCTCSFPVDGDGGKGYLLAFTWDSSPAVMMINGERQVMQGGEDQQDGSEETATYKFRNERFRLTVRINNEKRSGDEVWAYTGTVTVADTRTGHEQTLPLQGECGC